MTLNLSLFIMFGHYCIPYFTRCSFSYCFSRSSHHFRKFIIFYLIDKENYYKYQYHIFNKILFLSRTLYRLHDIDMITIPSPSVSASSSITSISSFDRPPNCTITLDNSSKDIAPLLSLSKR